MIYEPQFTVGTWSIWWPACFGIGTFAAVLWPENVFVGGRRGERSDRLWIATLGALLVMASSAYEWMNHVRNRACVERLAYGAYTITEGKVGAIVRDRSKAAQQGRITQFAVDGKSFIVRAATLGTCEVPSRRLLDKIILEGQQIRVTTFGDTILRLEVAKHN